MPATDKYKFGAANSLPALNKHEFGVTNSFPATDEHEFDAQEDIIHEFYEVKLGKQGFALRHKYEFGATNSFPALNKYEFGATNSFTALKDYKFGAQDALADFSVRVPTHTAMTTAHAAAQNHITGAFL